MIGGALALGSFSTALAQAGDPFGGGDEAADPFGDEGAGGGDDPFAAGPRQPRFDLDFPGGTLGELVAILIETNPELNIVMPDGVAQTKLPTMRLNQVSFSGMQEVVSSISPEGVHFQQIDNSLYVAQVLRPGKKPQMELKRKLFVFPARDLLRDRTVEDLMAVLQQAFELTDQKEMPKFSLHKETMVLMATLNPDQYSVVSDLFSVLDRPEVDGEERLQRQADTIEREIDKLTERFVTCQEKLTQIEDKLGKDYRSSVEHRLMTKQVAMIERELNTFMELRSRVRAQMLDLADLLPAATDVRGASGGFGGAGGGAVDDFGFDAGGGR